MQLQNPKLYFYKLYVYGSHGDKKIERNSLSSNSNKPQGK